MSYNIELRDRDRVLVTKRFIFLEGQKLINTLKV